MVVAAWGARGRRRYAWYVSETQDQADKHLENLAELLESSEIETYYPELANRKTSKYGNSKGWRRNRLFTSSGFVIDAIGLDTARRGARVAEQRPDAMVFDDIDGRHDGREIVKKKIQVLTDSLLPAGSNDLIVLFAQNLIHEGSIASQLAGVSSESANFLSNRIVSGPYPALENFSYETVSNADGSKRFILNGTATWQGQSLEACQAKVNLSGITSFRRESQHDLNAEPAAEYRHCDLADLPDLVRIVVWVDPAVTTTDKSDSHGIQVDGIDESGFIYRLYSWESITTPEDSLQRAIRQAICWKADHVGVETDQGGDAWKSVYAQAWSTVKAEDELDDKVKPRMVDAKAGAGHGSKRHRNQLMMADYGEARIIHLRGPHLVIESALNRFAQGQKPFDLADVGYWSWWDLREDPFKKKKIPKVKPFSFSKKSAWK